MRDAQPQPAFLQLEPGDLPSPVLDIGTGEGDLALGIAAMGRDVLGIDVDARAIATARARAHASGSTARFLELDVLDLPMLGRRFACVVDSGLLHTLDADARTRVASALAAVTEPGAAYHLLGFAERLPRSELERLCERGFRIAAIRAAPYVLRHDPAGVAGVLVTLRRVG